MFFDFAYLKTSKNNCKRLIVFFFLSAAFLFPFSPPNRPLTRDRAIAREKEKKREKRGKEANFSQPLFLLCLFSRKRKRGKGEKTSGAKIDNKAKFARLLANPLYTMMAEHETPHFATFVITCDCCGDSGIDPYMRSFDQSDVDICMPCFNDLRRQMTSPEAVKSAETLWKSQTDEHIAHMAAEKRKRDGDKGRSPRDPSLSLHEQDGPQAIIGELHSTLAKRSKK